MRNLHASLCGIFISGKYHCNLFSLSPGKCCGFIFFFLCSVNLYGIPTVITADSTALVALYNSTDGDNWNDNTNWLSGPVNTWYGVTVNSNRVTSLDLSDNNLIGTIP